MSKETLIIVWIVCGVAFYATMRGLCYLAGATWRVRDRNLFAFVAVCGPFAWAVFVSLIISTFVKRFIDWINNDRPSRW